MNERELKRFGREFALLIAAVFGLIMPLMDLVPVSVWPWGICGLIWFAAEIYPSLLKPLHVVWFRLSSLLAGITNPLVLAVVFFLIVTPLGLLKRAVGASKVSKRIDPSIDSYREPVILNQNMKDPY